ncbi:MAG: TonB-dependent receptor [Acidobacteriota bacterium]|nr:TonB-dependent receptor [Acidobacteriota bacterium]
MKFISSLFLLCFLAIEVFAQQTGTVSGTYRYNGFKETNTAITLSNESNKFTVFTNADSEFEFENVPPGKYIIENNNKLFKQEISVSAGQNLVVDIFAATPDESLQASIIREEVNVEISTGTSQPISEVSKTVNVIGEKEIRDRNEISLTDTLRTIPGFLVQQLGGFGRTASIKTRGLRNQDTAILIDGIRFRDPASITGDASAFLSDFTTVNVARIEVLRGSGSSVYGTNAIGGVVDFQTPEARKDFHGQLLGEYGGLGLKRVRGNTSFGTQNGKFGYTLGVARTIYSEGIDGEDDAHNTNFQGRIDYNPFSKTNISGRIFASDAYVRLNSSPDTFGNLPAITNIIDANEGVNFTADVNDPDNSQKSKFFSGQIALTQIIKPNFVFKASYQGLKTSRENENGGLGVGFQPFGGNQISIFNGQIHTLNTKFDWNTNRNNLLTCGYEFEREIYGNQGITPSLAGNFFADARQTSNTFFVQDLLGLFNDRLQLAGGFRMQWFSLDTPEFSVNNAPYNNLTIDNPPISYTFDGSASYYFTKTGTKIRGHIGNGYRVPSLYERLGTFYSSFSQSFIAFGDPNLEPERSIAFDAGIDQSLINNKLRLSATYFYTKLIDTIGFGNVVPNIGATTRPFGGYINQKGGISRGAEFSGDLKASDSTDIFASYTYTNSDQRSPQVAGSGIIETLGVPEHQFTLVATQRFGKRLSVNFDFLATGSYLAPIFSNQIFSTRIYRFEGNRRGDLTARYEIPAYNEKLRFSIFGTVENIFDNEYFENGFRTAGRTGRIGLGVNF